MKTSTILPGFAVVLTALAGCSAEIPTEGATAAPDEPSVAQQALAGPEGFYIQSITGSGSGCPSPPAYLLTPDQQTFTVYFSDMMLNHPPGSTFKYVNCAVGVSLHVPHGWQLSVGTINTRGYAHLPFGTSAHQRSTYSLAGIPLGPTFRSALNGFYDNNYTFTDLISVGSVITTPCGRDAILTINTALDLNTAGNPVSDAFVNNETIDGTFRKVFQFGWDHCVG